MNVPLQPGNERSDDGDDDLRAFLVAGDPVGDHPPLASTQVAEMVRAVTSAESAPGRSRRRYVTRAWGVVGLSAAAAAATVFVMSARVPVVPTPTELRAPVTASGQPAAMCAEVTPEGLRTLVSAFEAQVSAVDDNRVTLRVTKVFRGAVDESVVILQQQEGMPSEMSSGRFDVGRLYLIGTIDGEHIATCGRTGPATPELRQLYSLAFTH